MSQTEALGWRTLWGSQYKIVEGLPGSAVITVARAYRDGHLTKPLAEYTEEELLAVKGLGKKTVARIRERLERRNA